MKASSATWLAFILMASTLSSCYAGAGTSSKGDEALAVATPMDADVPTGIVTPKPVVGFYSGIYKARGSEPCCWLSDHASFQTRVPRGAKAIALTVVLPTLRVYQARPETLSVQLSGERGKKFGPLSIGQTILRIPLKPGTKERIVTIDLKPGYAFVPKRESINGDTRLLSVYLTDVHTE